MTRDEYYAMLKKRYEQVDWNSKDSIHAYNEYGRRLRQQMEEEEDAQRAGSIRQKKD